MHITVCTNLCGLLPEDIPEERAWLPQQIMSGKYMGFAHAVCCPLQEGSSGQLWCSSQPQVIYYATKNLGCTTFPPMHALNSYWT